MPTVILTKSEIARLLDMQEVIPAVDLTPLNESSLDVRL